MSIRQDIPLFVDDEAGPPASHGNRTGIFFKLPSEKFAEKGIFEKGMRSPGHHGLRIDIDYSGRGLFDDIHKGIRPIGNRLGERNVRKKKRQNTNPQKHLSMPQEPLTVLSHYHSPPERFMVSFYAGAQKKGMGEITENPERENA